MPFQGFPLLKLKALKKKKKKDIRAFSTRRAAKVGGEKWLSKRPVLELGAGWRGPGCAAQPHGALRDGVEHI